jgi:hypothetical protein
MRGYDSAKSAASDVTPLRPKIFARPFTLPIFL